MNIGSIVFIKNIIFHDYAVKGQNNKIVKKDTIDHSFSSGRPCIYIGELDDSMFFIPLSSTGSDSKYFILPSKTNRLTKLSIPNLRVIIKKPVSFYNEQGYLTEEEMYTLCKKLLSYYRKRDFDNSDSAKILATDYVMKYEKKNVKYVDAENKKNKFKK